MLNQLSSKNFSSLFLVQHAHSALALWDDLSLELEFEFFRTDLVGRDSDPAP